MTQPSPADTLRAAAERLRQPASVGAYTATPAGAGLLRAREPLARLLDAAVEHVEEVFMCCDYGPDHCAEVAGPAMTVARAVLGEQP
jgi:hypothetical protein